MDIRERGHLAAVAIPAQSYGEIDRRKSSRRRERNYVFVDACLSRETRSEEEEEAALETRAKEKERTSRSSSPTKFRTITIPRECSPNLAIPPFLLLSFVLFLPRRPR